jgi:hypothetical protein
MRQPDGLYDVHYVEGKKALDNGTMLGFGDDGWKESNAMDALRATGRWSRPCQFCRGSQARTADDGLKPIQQRSPKSMFQFPPDTLPKWALKISSAAF